MSNVEVKRPGGAPLLGTSVLLQVGLVAIVVVALPYKAFELDRYFVPKELILHLVALLAALLLFARMRTMTVDAADMLLAAFAVWSIVSALFATNVWLAQRAVGITVSSAVIFWAARRVGAEGRYRPILVAAAVATVVAAVTCLAQAYGIETEYFSLNRAPGGTFGNRNFVAHFCAIGLPALIYSTVTARRSPAAFAGLLGVAAVAAMLVLSRSRAAWLAVAASVAGTMIPLIASRKYWSAHKPIRGRLPSIAGAAALGAILAVAIPNRLNWSSDSPYLDSARAVVDYKSGSGRGRVAQYLNSLRMAVKNPVFGVGPGNWPVRYVRFAPESDPSIADDGMTANPWPSSDWAAYVSERGIGAAITLLGVFALLLVRAMRRWRDLGGADAVLAKVALVATIAATLVVSLFDAALLLAPPALLAWSVLGAASGAGRRGRDVTFPRRTWAVGAVALVALVVVSAVRSAAQVIAIATVGTGGTRAGWVRAAQLDPGSYRINLRVAELYVARGQCARARGYARRAVGLFPNAPEAKQLLSRCG